MSTTSQKTFTPALLASRIVSSGEPNEVMMKSIFSSHQTFNCSLYRKLDLLTIKLIPKGPFASFLIR